MATVTDSQGAVLRRIAAIIPNVKSIGTVGVGRALRDVTALSDSVHKSKLNIPDVPDIAIEVWYDPDDPMHAQVITDEVLGTVSQWVIDIEQGASPESHLEFTAYVHGCEVGPFEVDGDIMLKFNLKPQTLVQSFT